MYEQTDAIELTEGLIEAYMDRHGVAKLLVMIEDICHEKAGHCESNWQEHGLARRWHQGANKIGRASEF